MSNVELGCARALPADGRSDVGAMGTMGTMGMMGVMLELWVECGI